MKKTITLLLVMLMLTGLSAWAADGDVFTAKTVEGVDMTFKVISESNKTCQVWGSNSTAPPYAIDVSTTGSITIPASVTGDSGTSYSVTAIGFYALSTCKGLTSVNIPSSVETIENGAFSNCSGLTSITIPNSVTTIRDAAFSRCTGLTSVTIPSSVNRIFGNVFYGCSKLKEILVDSGNSNYVSKDGVLYTKDLTSIIVYPLGKEGQEYSILNSVRIIGNYAFYECSSLKSVTIPNSVTKIERFAFAGCSGLTSAVLPSSLTTIEHSAFSGCSSLSSVNIPKPVTTIEEQAFNHCTGLSTLSVESGNSVYDSRNNSNAIIHTGTNELILGCQNTIIPNSVTSIGNFAFMGCSGLTSLTIPNSVTSIGNYAFYNCSGLTSLAIPNGVTSIGNYTFYGCKGLTSLTIPNSVTSIGNSAFYLCSGLTSLTIPNGVTSIGDYAFAGSGLTLLTIPNSVTSIGISAFQNCDGLTSLTIPNSVTKIGQYAFFRCLGLKKMTSEITEPFAIADNTFNNYSIFLYVPEGTKALYQATDGWKNFTNIVEGEGEELNDGDVFTAKTVEGVEMTFKVISAKDKTCQVGTGVTNESCIDKSTAGSLTIPAIAKGFKVTTIASWALFRCYNITELTISEGIERLNSNSIEECSGITSIILPASVTYLDVAFGGFSNNLKSIKVAEGNPKYDSRDNCNAIIETATNTLRSGCSTTVIPSSVTAIGAWSMSNNGLLSIDIPENITSIGEGAFRYNNIKEITIPASVKTIGYSAFSYSWNLEKVTILSKELNWRNAAFGNCSKLREVVSYVETPTSSSGWLFYNYYDKETEQYLMYDDAVLYVPAGTKTLYEQTAGWNNFKNIVEMNGDVFTAKTKEGVTMTFKILSREDMTCQVGNGEEASVDVATSGQVTIPEVANGYKVTAIGDKGFYNCAKLTHIWLHGGIERIGKLAFYGCTSLRVLDIPHSIVSIADDAFEGCANLKVGIPSDLIGSLPYNPSPGSGVVIVITPPSESPAALYELERIYIPKAVVSIDERSFSNCRSVKVMEVDAENTVFDSRENCNAIISTADNTLLFGCQNTIIPATVTAIAAYAFEGHSKLKTISIPQNVASIGESAFSGCTALTAITSNISVPFAINDNTFSEDTYRNATLTVPAGTKALYQATDGWKNFFNILEKEIEAIIGDEDIAFGGEDSEIDEDTDLNGNVVGNIYYIIQPGNGGYDAVEGCIEVTKPTTDEEMEDLVGKDLFGEDMKNHFTGIVFKVPAGQGRITVNAETLGGMTLKVKIGNQEPFEMMMVGKMELKIPYNVNKPTYVYIYAGEMVIDGARGNAKASVTSSLKIYGIEIHQNPGTATDIENEKMGIGENDKPCELYDLSGRRMTNQTKGLNIIRMGDGRVKKVVKN